MVHHHPVADGNFSNAGADCVDDAAGFVAGDFEAGRVAPVGLGGAAVAQVAAAEARRLRSDDYFARPWAKAGQGTDFNFAVSG